MTHIFLEETPFSRNSSKIEKSLEIFLIPITYIKKPLIFSFAKNAIGMTQQGAPLNEYRVEYKDGTEDYITSDGIYTIGVIDE